MKRNNRLVVVVVLMLILALTLGLAACSQANGGQTSSGAGSAGNSSASNSGNSGASNSGNSGDNSNNNNSNSGNSGDNSNNNNNNSNSSNTNDSASNNSTSGVTVPDGFTERDFDIGYSDYETITLSGSTASTTASGVTVSGNTVKITSAGNYLLTGELKGQIVIDVPGADDKVQLILDNATITNESSAAIYVLNADKVFVTTTSGSVNKVSTTGAFVQTDENDVDGAIFSKDDIVFNGQGTLIVTSARGHGIVSKDDLKITSGTYEITAADKGLSANDLIAVAGGDITIDAVDDGMNAELEVHIIDGNIAIDAGDDAIHADAILTIDGGTINIAAAEGLEATVVTMNDGDVSISASDDGINAGQKVNDYTPTIEINGGSLTVNMARGDTDALDSNGYLYITGGVVNISAQFAFDYEWGGEITGGEVYVNGEQVTVMTNSMMGGPGGWGGGQPGGGRP